MNENGIKLRVNGQEIEANSSPQTACCQPFNDSALVPLPEGTVIGLPFGIRLTLCSRCPECRTVSGKNYRECGYKTEVLGDDNICDPKIIIANRLLS